MPDTRQEPLPYTATLHAFMARWANNLVQHPEWRVGQAAVNSMNERYTIPDGCDPFHDDEFLPEFLAWARGAMR